MFFMFLYEYINFQEESSIEIPLITGRRNEKKSFPWKINKSLVKVYFKLTEKLRIRKSKFIKSHDR